MTPERIGPYEILGELGQGAFGEVKRGRHLRTGRMAAVKILHRKYAQDEQVVERFFQDAKAACRLHHPAIVPIYEVDLDPGSGRPFFAMQPLEGEDLRDSIRRQRALSYRHRIDILIQVADGLHYAHGLGIIHRDVKPSNIFLLPSGVVKLIDFGIAKVPDADLTGTHLWLGTLAYASPEQLEQARSVDPRSDLFSLGVVAYELLSFRRPFVGDDERSVRDAVRRLDPPPLHELDDSGYEWLDGLVRRCLRKQPAQRWRSCAEFAQALRIDLDKSTLVVRPARRKAVIAPGPGLPRAGTDDVTGPLAGGDPVGVPARASVAAPASPPARPPSRSRATPRAASPATPSAPWMPVPPAASPAPVPARARGRAQGASATHAPRLRETPELDAAAQLRERRRARRQTLLRVALTLTVAAAVTALALLWRRLTPAPPEGLQGSVSAALATGDWSGAAGLQLRALEQARSDLERAGILEREAPRTLSQLLAGAAPPGQAAPDEPGAQAALGKARAAATAAVTLCEQLARRAGASGPLDGAAARSRLAELARLQESLAELRDERGRLGRTSEALIAQARIRADQQQFADALAKATEAQATLGRERARLATASALAPWLDLARLDQDVARLEAALVDSMGHWRRLAAGDPGGAAAAAVRTPVARPLADPGRGSAPSLPVAATPRAGGGDVAVLAPPTIASAAAPPPAIAADQQERRDVAARARLAASADAETAGRFQEALAALPDGEMGPALRTEVEARRSQLLSAIGSERELSAATAEIQRAPSEDACARAGEIAARAAAWPALLARANELSDTIARARRRLEAQRERARQDDLEQQARAAARAADWKRAAHSYRRLLESVDQHGASMREQGVDPASIDPELAGQVFLRASIRTACELGSCDLAAARSLAELARRFGSSSAPPGALSSTRWAITLPGITQCNDFNLRSICAAFASPP